MPNAMPKPPARVTTLSQTIGRIDRLRVPLAVRKATFLRKKMRKPFAIASSTKTAA